MIDATTAEVPVDVRPGPSLNVPRWWLPGLSGACANHDDLFALAQASPHLSVAACTGECENRLDVDECFSDCVASPVSPACLGCYIEFASCSDGACYEQFLECTGVPADHILPHGAPLRFECSSMDCYQGARAAASCTADEDCLSRSCVPLDFAGVAGSICGLPEGSRCSSSALCSCAEGHTYCGSCLGEGRVASAVGSFNTADCYRECTSQGQAICSVGSPCSAFSSGDRRYCN